MTTEIRSNGSKWAGESPDPIEKLYEVLQSNTLDPTFEEFGNFAMQEKGKWFFWGNFFDVSHVFSVRTDDTDVIDTMLALIKINQGSRAYLDAKQLRREQDEQTKAYFKVSARDRRARESRARGTR